MGGQALLIRLIQNQEKLPSNYETPALSTRRRLENMVQCAIICSKIDHRENSKK